MIRMAIYNPSHEKPFEVLNIVGNMKSNNPHILIYGSWEDEDLKSWSENMGRALKRTRSERGIWNAVACLSEYDRRLWGTIIQTLPLPSNMEASLRYMAKDQRPFYLIDSISEQVLAITPWKRVRKTIHGLALKEASEYLGREGMFIHVGGDCDEGANFYHDRYLDVKKVRDFISEEEYTDRIKLFQLGHNQISQGLEEIIE